jgi:uncharacterized protein (DUF1778 family)
MSTRKGIRRKKRTKERGTGTGRSYIILLVSDAEKRAVWRAAKAAGLNRSNFVRRRLGLKARKPGVTA